MSNIVDMNLPIYIENENDYLSAIKNEIDKYKKNIESLLEEDYLKQYVKKIRKYLNNYASQYAMIEEILKSSLNGNNKKGYKKFEIMYNDLHFLKTSICSSQAFKGNLLYTDINSKLDELSLLRGRITAPYHCFQAKEMLHVPLNKRGIIDTCRYSIPGVPSFYLAENSFIVWNEMRRPKLSELCISSINCDGILNSDIIDLTIPIDKLYDYLDDSTIDFKEYSIILKWIKAVPLILACSVVCKEEKRKFKIEYIIPQMFMQLLNEDLIGIAYRTNRVDTQSWRLNNLVIPILSYKDDLYGNIINNLKISDSINIGYFNEHLYNNTIQISSLKNGKGPTENTYKDANFNLLSFPGKSNFNKRINTSTKLDGQTFYIHTVFHQFDEYLLYMNEQFKFNEKGEKKE